MLGYFILIGLIGPVLMERSKSSAAAVSCEKADVDECMKKLQTFTRITSLPFTSEPKELDDLCEQAIAGYNCSVSMITTKDCLSTKEKELAQLFTQMAEYMFFMICGDKEGEPGYLREAFLFSSGCILKNKEKIDCCVRESHITDLPILRIMEDPSKSTFDKQVAMCCPVSNHLKCTRTVTEESCGEKEGNFTQEYIRRAAGELVQAACQKMPEYPEPDPKVCPAMEDTCTGCGALHLASGILMSVLSFLSVRWAYRQ